MGGICARSNCGKCVIVILHDGFSESCSVEHGAHRKAGWSMLPLVSLVLVLLTIGEPWDAS